jgi:hypothetical protein
MILYTLALLFSLAAIGVVYRRAVARWVWESRLGRWCVTYIAPLPYWPTRNVLTKKQYRECYRVIEVGDEVHTLSRRTIGSLFTPGEDVTHSSRCVGKTTAGAQIAEMTSENYGVVDLREVAKHSRAVIVTRPRFGDGGGQRAADKCLEAEDADYDETFRIDNNRNKIPMLSCADLLEFSDVDKLTPVEPERISWLGYDVITPQGFFNAAKRHGAIVFDSRKFT